MGAVPRGGYGGVLASMPSLRREWLASGLDLRREVSDRKRRFQFCIFGSLEGKSWCMGGLVPQGR